MTAVVDQRRAANARRIARMGGPVAAGPSVDVSALEDLFGDDGRDGAIRDTTGRIVRVL